MTYAQDLLQGVFHDVTFTPMMNVLLLPVDWSRQDSLDVQSNLF